MKGYIRRGLCLLSALSLMLCGCGEGAERREAEKETVKVVAAQGDGALSLLKMREKDRELGGRKAEYVFLETSGEVIEAVRNGDYDLALIPFDAAAALYNAGAGCRLLGIASWGNIYLVGSGDVSEFRDLAGETVYAAEEGLTGDLIMRYLRSALKIRKKVTLKYTYGQLRDLTDALAGGEAGLAVLPEPYASQAMEKDPRLKILLDLQQCWTDTAKTEFMIPVTAVVANGGSAAAGPGALEDFREQFSDSSAYLMSNPAQAASLAEKYGVTFPPQAVEKGSVRCRTYFRSAQDVSNGLEEYMSLILGYADDELGGKLPGDGFYVPAG